MAQADIQPTAYKNKLITQIISTFLKKLFKSKRVWLSNLRLWLLLKISIIVIRI